MKVILLVFVLFLTACSDERHSKDLRQYFGQLKHETEISSKSIMAIQKLQPPQAVVYQAKEFRSPFSEASSVSTADSKFSPLTAYPIDALTLVGTIHEGSQYKAVIAAPDSKVYQVKIGDLIGNHYGKIIRIESTRLELMEQISEDGKQVAEHKVVLQLKDSKS